MAPFTISDDEFSSLRGSVAVITGGSSGIALACAELLLAQGANVVIGDIQAPPPKILADGAAFVPVDVTSWEHLKILFENTVKTFGRVDHVFANAGIEGRENYVEDDLDDDAELKAPKNLAIHINLIGVINTTRLAIHYLKKNSNGGSIVMTASASSFQRFSSVDYAASKHGVLGFMRGLAGHLYPKLPIRVNAISPSWTATALVPVDLCKAAGVPVQSTEVVARSVLVLMADSQRNQQLIYSVSGVYTEIENDLLKAADSIRPKETSEDEDLHKLAEASTMHSQN
ncbi:hypothetical protein E8E14_002030 [Neopestalotiopsis sp. 37M]|nr:hypothetical protein E8E14_002030 [Neopestalotiopsis sp. 37M]